MPTPYHHVDGWSTMSSFNTIIALLGCPLKCCTRRLLFWPISIAAALLQYLIIRARLQEAITPHSSGAIYARGQGRLHVVWSSLLHLARNAAWKLTHSLYRNIYAKGHSACTFVQRRSPPREKVFTAKRLHAGIILVSRLACVRRSLHCFFHDSKFMLVLKSDQRWVNTPLCAHELLLLFVQ